MLEQKALVRHGVLSNIHVVLQIVADLSAGDEQMVYMKEDWILETSEHCSSEEARGQLDTAIDWRAIPNSSSTKTALERYRSARISYNPLHES